MQRIALAVLILSVTAVYWWLSNLYTFSPSDNLLMGAKLQRPGWVAAGLADGAPVDVCDESGMTALMWAARDGDLELMRELLRQGADPRLQSVDSNTALGFAAMHGECEAIELLLSAGANANDRAYGGGTPLHLAVALGQSEAVQLLINHGADVNARDGRGRTALEVAKERGESWQPIVELLLDRGAVPQANIETTPTARADVSLRSGD
jgi:ankyrin repeat protein